jgi:hypothetical protein
MTNDKQQKNLSVHIHEGITNTHVYIENGVVHIKPNTQESDLEVKCSGTLNGSVQSAVDFYREYIHAFSIDGKTHYTTTKQVYEEAKKMEKEQIIKAIDSNYTYNDNQISTIGEQYYNETYGGNK